MDGYFKLLRAEEEIQRLNIEIPRFATFIRDEDLYLHTIEQQVHTSQPALAFQIHMKHMETSRYNALHIKILNQTTSLKGFTGSRLYGTHIPDVPLSVGVAHVTQPPPPPPPADELPFDEDVDREEDLEEEQAGEDRDDAVLGAYYNVLEFSYDDATAHLTVP
jgi:hypothetical protein